MNHLNVFENYTFKLKLHPLGANELTRETDP